MFANVGGMSKYLNRIISDGRYNNFKSSMSSLVNSIPGIGTSLKNGISRVEEAAKGLLTPGIIFEELGLRYFGPVDGHDIDVVRETLAKDIRMTTQRHEFGASIFKGMGDVAPAMGMIGTLIGLVAMLSNMDDPKAIGPAMAVALLTTLYGAFFANVICLPVAAKLTNRTDEEKLNQSLVLDGIVGIADGQNPRVIEGILKNYLAASKRAETTDEE